MLMRRDIAVIRAALQYFQDELCPHGPEVYRPYFDEPMDKPVKGEDVRRLRESLRNCEMRYLVCDRQASRAIHSELFTSIDRAEVLARKAEGKVGVAIIPSL